MLMIMMEKILEILRKVREIDVILDIKDIDFWKHLIKVFGSFGYNWVILNLKIIDLIKEQFFIFYEFIRENYAIAIFVWNQFCSWLNDFWFVISSPGGKIVFFGKQLDRVFFEIYMFLNDLPLNIVYSLAGRDYAYRLYLLYLNKRRPSKIKVYFEKQNTDYFMEREEPIVRGMSENFHAHSQAAFVFFNILFFSICMYYLIFIHNLQIL